MTVAADRAEWVAAIADLKADTHREFETLTRTINQRFAGQDATQSAFAVTVEQRFAAAAAATAAMMSASAKAVEVAADGLGETLAKMNEFRRESQEDRIRYIDRSEAVALIAKENALIVAVDGKVVALKEYVDKQTGRGLGLSLGAKIAVGVLSSAVTLLSIISLVVGLSG